MYLLLYKLLTPGFASKSHEKEDMGLETVLTGMFNFIFKSSGRACQQSNQRMSRNDQSDSESHGTMKQP